MRCDGFGYCYQASLVSKLTLGSVLIAPTSLFPLWYDALLEDGTCPVRNHAPSLQQ